jgi:hypothetical protein
MIHANKIKKLMEADVPMAEGVSLKNKPQTVIQYLFW